MKNRQQTQTRSGISTAKVAVYASVFTVLVAVIALGYERPSTLDNPKQSTVASSFVPVGTRDDTPSVDAIVANDVAARLTEQANLPIATTVANTSVSLAAQSELAQSDDTAIAKPQIVQTDNAGRSIISYKVKASDDVNSIAKEFNISPDTVRWANDIIGDAVENDRTLKILPITGVIHKVNSGDTVASIAKKYGSSEARIKLFNDLDLAKPTSGQQLIIPDGSLPKTERPGYEAPVAAQPSQSYGGGSGSRISSNVFATSGNKYAPGNCTWYAYERRVQLGRPVGSYWGNANTWAYNARAAGLTVNNSPVSGAILVDTAGYFGHVGIVESVKSNGDIMITEMNNYAYGGFNIVNSRTIPAGQASAYQYIH